MKGDWVSGSEIVLQTGSQVSFEESGSMTISLMYRIQVPSGEQIFIPTPYPYSADTANTISTEFASAVEELANQEGIPVQFQVAGQAETVTPE